MTENLNGVADSLALRHQATLAIPPSFGDAKRKPTSVKNIRIIENDNQLFLTWDAPLSSSSHPSDSDVVRYVVYQFFPDEEIDTEDAETIITITPHTAVLVEDSKEGPNAEGSTFVVTSLDRMNRESAPVVCTFKR